MILIIYLVDATQEKIRKEFLDKKTLYLIIPKMKFKLGSIIIRTF